MVSLRFEKRISSEKAAVYNVKHELSQSFLDWFHRFENTVDGSDSWFDTSGVGNSEYKECKGNPTLSWKSSGYSRVLDIMMVSIMECYGVFLKVYTFIELINT